MKTLNVISIKSVTIAFSIVAIVFLGFSFKSADTNGQVMTVVALQSKSSLKGDQDLCLILDGNIIEKIAIPSAFSTKLEDQSMIVTTINKTLNRLAKEGWRLDASDNNMRHYLLSR